jgi:hypothetical protein
VAKPKIISREYKLLLRATLFQGADTQLIRSAKIFWHDFGRAVGTIARDTDGRMTEGAAPDPLLRHRRPSPPPQRLCVS